MKCMCVWVIVERNFAIQTHKSVVSVFSSVRAIKVLWNICVCECVSVFSFLKSIPWKRNGSKYTIYTSLLLLPLLLLLVETFRNRWLSAPSDLVSNSFAYTLLIFSSVSCRRKDWLFLLRGEKLFVFVTKYSDRKNRIFALHYFIWLLSYSLRYENMFCFKCLKDFFCSISFLSFCFTVWH